MNGLIIDGKVYEVGEDKKGACHLCDIRDFCKAVMLSHRPSVCICFDDKAFNYSPDLTDKLNGKDNRD